MEQYISKFNLVAEIERRIKELQDLFKENKKKLDSFQKTAIHLCIDECKVVLNILDTLEVKDPYEQVIQYSSIEDGIKAHAEDYSWNIESELFQQLTPEQQKLWRKEIEQAVISGGYSGLNLAKDPRYKENLEVKEVDLEKELESWRHNHFHGRRDIFASGEYLERVSQLELAKHFFELGIKKFINESIIRKIVDLNDEAAKHYDAIIRKENKENGFSQLAIDLFEHNVDAKELCIQYVIENLKVQKEE